MKSVEECFTGSEALDWLHKHLRKNPNFESDVSREQILLLLQKILRSGLITPACPSGGDLSTSTSSSVSPTTNTLSNYHHEFSLNELYRFVDYACEKLRTPGKKTKTALEPLEPNTPSRWKSIRKNKSDRSSVVLAPAPPPAFAMEGEEENQVCAPDRTNDAVPEEEEAVCGPPLSQRLKHQLNRSYFQSLPQQSLIAIDNDSIWSEAFTSQLRKTLSVAHVQNIDINISYLTFNMTRVSSKGVVQLEPNGPYEDLLPHWVLSAMKCLANWPRPIKLINGQETSLPSYPGFINDVYSVVKDYFLTLGSPLIPYELYDLFESAFIKAEAVGAKFRYVAAPNVSQWRPQDTTHFTSTPAPPSLGLNALYGSSHPRMERSSLSSSRRGCPPTFYTMQDEVHFYPQLSKQERVARIRQTLTMTTRGGDTSSAACTITNQSSSLEASSSLGSPSSGMLSELDASAIMRNVLPPNSCFETAFMNERPVTRIVPQKHNETLHLHPPPQHHVRSHLASSGLSGRCYTPIPSGGSVISNWDSRSIATQTSVEEDETADEGQQQSGRLRRKKKKDVPSADSSILSRIPRRRRSARSRKSIAVMEFSDTASVVSSKSGMVNPAFEDSPTKRIGAGNCGLQKGYSSVDDLLNEDSSKFLHKYEQLSIRGSQRREQTSSQICDHMIQSKTVRKEKRKQKEKRDRAHSLDRTLDSQCSSSGARFDGSSSYLLPPHQRQQQQQQQPYQLTRFHKLTVKTPVSSSESHASAYRDPLPSQGMQSVRAEPYYNTSSSANRNTDGGFKNPDPHALSLSAEGVSCAASAFALLGLLLPPGSRRKLQLLLKFIKRVSNNSQLRLSTEQDNYHLFLETFSDSILRAKDMTNYDGDMSRKIVAFFISHYEDVWTPPKDLRKEVEESVSF